MKFLIPFLMALCFTGCHLQKACPGHGWSSAQSICFRVVHYPESFWAARAWCNTVQGNLLSLHNVKQVMDALGDSMEGNAGEYRIDGWAKGTWYHKENETLENVDYELLSELSGKTLTVDLQDGRVHSDTEEGTRLGFICEGSGELTCIQQDEVAGSSPPRPPTDAPPRPSAAAGPAPAQKAVERPTELGDDAIIMVEYTAPSLPDPSAYQYASIFVTEKDAATGKYCSSDCIHSDYRAKYKVGDGALVEDMAKAIEAKPGQKVQTMEILKPFNGYFGFLVYLNAEVDIGEVTVTLFPPASFPNAKPHVLENKVVFGGDLMTEFDMATRYYLRSFCVNAQNWATFADVNQAPTYQTHSDEKDKEWCPLSG